MNNAVRFAPSPGRSEQSDFEVAVVFTSEAETADALKTAVALATDLSARIILVAVCIVPYPLPLDRPPVSVEHLCGRLRAVAAEARVRVDIRLYFGRDAAETLASVLPADAIIAFGRRRSRWPTRPLRLARRLRRLGQATVLALLQYGNGVSQPIA